MPDVVSFRPTAEEERVIARTQRRLRLRTRTEAIRYLLRQAGETDDGDPVERFFAMRAPPEYRTKRRSVTTEQIDEVVYGEHLRHDDHPR